MSQFNNFNNPNNNNNNPNNNNNNQQYYYQHKRYFTSLNVNNFKRCLIKPEKRFLGITAAGKSSSEIGRAHV